MRPRTQALVHNCFAHPAWFLSKQLVDAVDFAAALGELCAEVAKAVAGSIDDAAVRWHDRTAGVDDLPGHAHAERGDPEADALDPGPLDIPDRCRDAVEEWVGPLDDAEPRPSARGWGVCRDDGRRTET